MSAMYLQPIPAYVYKIRNKSTNQYYFGFRKAHIKANRTPEEDFLIYYYSSSILVQSMIVEQGIDQFECNIVYQDIDAEKAFWYEQDLIKEYWDDPLLLNKQYRDKETSKGIFLLSSHSSTSKSKISAAHKGKTVSSQSIEKMVATRRARGNYKQSDSMVEKMLATKQRNGTTNSNTPESRAKSRQTKIERYGVPQPKHTLETIAKLKSIPHSPERVAKCIETKKKNGTLNSNTPETIAKRKETLLAKWGTTNTREIGKLKSQLNNK